MDRIANSIERRVRARRQRLVMTPGEISARLEVIATIAPPLGRKYLNWIPRSDESFYYWTFFEVSNYTTLPFPGGMVDQPKWLLADFEAYIEITEYNELLVEKEELERRLLEHGG